MVGSRDRIRALLLERPPQMPEKRDALPAPLSNARAKAGTPSWELELTNYLIQRFAALTKMEPRQIRSLESLEKYGFDSIMAVEFSQQLEHNFRDPAEKVVLGFTR